ncbi:hypothetical protein M9H77_08559 [Catharanthus roseus]|uniref:Uncharacterized protein n=1 Tax=Catharanthus roseus TaxID=4058 RepID=A0ACC0BYF5_CATRO|nr:hypothetical protein M9H77_08559 [Catharanthus roseus]
MHNRNTSAEKLDIANDPNDFTNELIRKILKYRDMDPNLWIVRMIMRVPSYYEVHQMRYLWTIPPHHTKEGIYILVEFEQIQQHSIPITQDINTTDMTEHITALTQMVSDELSMFYPIVNDGGDEFLQIKMKSREHKVITYNLREGIYMVRSPIRCVEKMSQEQILICRRYIRDKRTEELTKRIFIRS